MRAKLSRQRFIQNIEHLESRRLQKTDYSRGRKPQKVFWPPLKPEMAVLTTFNIYASNDRKEVNAKILTGHQRKAS